MASVSIPSAGLLGVRCARPLCAQPHLLPLTNAPSLPSLQVTEDDVDKFFAEFRGGEEERQEVLKYYQQFQGDMDRVRGRCGVLGNIVEEEGHLLNSQLAA